MLWSCVTVQLCLLCSLNWPWTSAVSYLSFPSAGVIAMFHNQGDFELYILYYMSVKDQHY